MVEGWVEEEEKKKDLEEGSEIKLIVGGRKNITKVCISVKEMKTNKHILKNILNRRWNMFE